MKYAETTEEKVIEARKNTQKMCSIKIWTDWYGSAGIL